ncbi:hypothetical protein E2C01_087512 [Portunus trituberculatus]|uniref:Uncharacterized protein n=1 Tax=Portunus trituberculatus TaxID=210409 RepID=A0A5B7JDJ8_PORTR|nr:hypothetical protein [Portunus trituberculatus]
MTHRGGGYCGKDMTLGAAIYYTRRLVCMAALLFLHDEEAYLSQAARVSRPDGYWQHNDGVVLLLMWSLRGVSGGGTDEAGMEEG